MKTDWRLVAEARGLVLTGMELDRIVPVLEALETVFRPLVAGIPHEVEPAITLSDAAVAGE